MNKALPMLDRDALREFMQSHQLLPVKAAPEGRFILYVPDLQDGKGPILAPNIKELEAKIRGSEGDVQSIELEAGPQRIPTNGTNVIVINRVDEFVQLALKAKLEHLIDNANGEMTRDVINEFMSYARGYEYDPEKQTITFCRNIGFRNDVYNMSLDEFKKRYVRHSRPDLPLDDVKDENIRSGYYIKKQLLSGGLFLEGAFQVQVPTGAGDTVQAFEHGAMVNMPDDPTLPISFIHLTDINTCYTERDGKPIVARDGGNALPSYDVADVLPKRPTLSAKKAFKPGR